MSTLLSNFILQLFAILILLLSGSFNETVGICLNKPSQSFVLFFLCTHFSIKIEPPHGIEDLKTYVTLKASNLHDHIVFKMKNEKWTYSWHITLYVHDIFYFLSPEIFAYNNQTSYNTNNNLRFCIGESFPLKLYGVQLLQLLSCGIQHGNTYYRISLCYRIHILFYKNLTILFILS